MITISSFPPVERAAHFFIRQAQLDGCSMSGWLKLHRNIVDHWIFSFDEPDKALAWIYILTKANHTKSTFKIKNTLIQVERGQLAVSQITLQKQFKWSQNKLKRFLKLLKNERMVDYETNALTTIITVCNYNDYQMTESVGERPDGRTSERPDERSVNDQTNDIKEGKELKKAKKKPVEIDIPAWLNSKSWSEFEQHRIDIKKPLTNLARTKAINSMEGLTLDQQQRCIDQSIQSRWAGIFPDKYRDTTAQPAPSIKINAFPTLDD